jgi:hypothetical protein
MTVIAGGKLTDWVWTFAGPGHPRAIAQKDRIMRESLDRNRQIEQAQINGKKWKAPARTAADVLEDNVVYVLERLIGWSPVSIGGEDYPFSEDNARKLLVDPKKGALLAQSIEFIQGDDSFTQGSAKS